VTSYYVTVVSDLRCESESTFTMYPNPDSLIEYHISFAYVDSHLR